MCDVRTDVKNGRVENSEDFLVFSEEDVSDEVGRVFDLELSSASQVDIKGDDSEHGTSLSSSICNSEIGIMPEEAKEDEGYRWKSGRKKENWEKSEARQTLLLWFESEVKESEKEMPWKGVAY